MQKCYYYQLEVSCFSLDALARNLSQFMYNFLSSSCSAWATVCRVRTAVHILPAAFEKLLRGD